MRKAVSIGVLSLSLAAAAGAAEIHGTISDGGKPVPKGVAVKLDCGATTASATTDEFGSYSVKTGATGDCRLSIDYKGSTPSLKVTLYEKPGRYDLVVKEDAGKLTLARK